MTAPDSEWLKMDAEMAPFRKKVLAAIDEHGSATGAIGALLTALADRDAAIARLQARLDAGPTVDQLREWAGSAFLKGANDAGHDIYETANRMEAANAE